MELLTKTFIRVHESMVRTTRGQTMTEYALILTAVAVVAYGTCGAVGNGMTSVASGVDSFMTNS
jgi:Flp pilus assembly pilin Flp